MSKVKEMQNKFIKTGKWFFKKGKWFVNGLIITGLLLGLGLFVLKGCPALFKSSDVLFSFAVTADSQYDPADPDLSLEDQKWGVNSTVWNRIVDEIGQQNPSMLIFAGDSITGYTQGDMQKLASQYAFWRGSIIRLLEQGIYVFPVPGNHEMEDGDIMSYDSGARLANEDAWRENMGDLIPDKTLWERCLGVPFSASSWSHVDYAQSDSDGIMTDQSQLSYSFDYKGAHFIIINTSAVGNEYHMPIMRLKEDLFDARRRGVKHIFIFGHYPAFSYKYNASSRERGLGMDVKARDQFWELVQEYNATYFCGHEHLFNASQPAGGKAYQVIVGPAGGGFKAPKPVRNPDLYKYTWVIAKVHKNGNVHLDCYGFSSMEGKTRVLKCWDLDEDF